MINLSNDRLKQQLNFLFEIDKLKTIFRQSTLITDTNRFENSAEHSWHLAFYVLILAEHATVEINLLRVLKMVILHDIVEIDAGDTFVYDTAANMNKQQLEQRAAERIFGLLPLDQRNEFIELWQEFEANETADAKFAGSVDRLHPLLHNYMTGGGSWKRHDISRKQVEIRMKPIADGSTLLADLVKSILDDAVNTHILKP